MAFDKKDYCVLVVDDEPEMNEMIADYLTDIEGYRVLSAARGREALEEVLPNHHVDLVLSDINMPEMKGFELLNRVRAQYPHIKRMLITAYNVEDYLELALKHDVGNIFAKTTPFNFPELSSTIEQLLTNSIFGLQRYFDDDAAGRGISVLVKESGGIHDCANRIVGHLPENPRVRKLELVLVEMITNAVFYGARRESPEDKGTWNHTFTLSDKEAIVVSAMFDNDKFGISIADGGGRISKANILFWINRQAARDESGIPLGIFDSHGRGLFIARQYIDRLVINVDRERKTEIIMINYLTNVYKGYKPLYINEI